MMLQEVRQYADKDIYLSDIKPLVDPDVLRSRQNRLSIAHYEESEEFLKGLKKEPYIVSDQLLKMETNQRIPLAFFNQANSYGHMAAVKIEVSENSFITESIIINGSSIVLMNDRIVIAAVSCVHKSANDLEWVESKTKNWISSLVQANPNNLPYNKPNKPISISEIKRFLESLYLHNQH